MKKLIVVQIILKVLQGLASMPRKIRDVVYTYKNKDQVTGN